MFNNDNVKQTVIPIIKNTTITELNNDVYVPEKEPRPLWTLVCVYLLYLYLVCFAALLYNILNIIYFGNFLRVLCFNNICLFTLLDK